MKKTIRIVSKPIKVEVEDSPVKGFMDVVSDQYDIHETVGFLDNVAPEVLEICHYYLNIMPEDCGEKALIVRGRYYNLFTVEELD